MRHCLVLSFILLSLMGPAQVESRLLSPLPDLARDDATGFAIDGIGYIQGGRMEGFAISNQLWAYEPVTDHWTSRSALPGVPRQYASSFVLDGQAYLLGGAADPNLRLDELWRYDPLTDAWTQLNDFPGEERYAMTAFVYQGVAYAGLGKGYDSYYDDLWRYEPTADTWELVAQFSMPLFSPVQFALDGKIYIGTGQDELEAPIAHMWRFDGEEIHQVEDHPQALTSADALSLSGLALIIGGSPDTDQAIDGFSLGYAQLSAPYSQDIHWRSHEGLAGGEVRNGAVFAIGDQAYYYGGKDRDDLRSNRLIGFSLSPQKNQIDLAPNPSCDYVRISSEEAFDRLELYTQLGQPVYTQVLVQPTRTLSLSLADLAPGSYLLKLGSQEALSILCVCGN